MGSNSILPLLGIPEEKVSSYDAYSENGFSTILVELKDERGLCPRCHSKNIVIKDYYFIYINNSIVKNLHTQVKVRMRRYKCKDCNKTFKQGFGISASKCSISYVVKNAIIESLKEPLPYSTIARLNNVSISSVINIFDQHVKYMNRLPLSEVICIDEFHFSHEDKENRFPCVISNGFNSKIIDIVYSRRKPYLIEYFNKISIMERNKVRFFISDMHETYRQIKRHFFKNAKYVVDKFHITRLFTEAIQRIRTRLLANIEYDSKEYRFLKKNWKIFLKRRGELKHSKTIDNYGVVYNVIDDLDSCLNHYSSLQEAYWIKEDFLRIMTNDQTYVSARKNFYFFLNRLEKSVVPELNKISKTLLNWEEEIIAAYCLNDFGLNLSNSHAEGNNNFIQTMIDASYGFKNFDRARRRILYINRFYKS